MTFMERLRYNFYWVVIAWLAMMCLNVLVSTWISIGIGFAIIWFVMPLVEGNERLKDEVTV